jgi:hypothetical protein
LGRLYAALLVALLGAALYAAWHCRDEGKGKDGHELAMVGIWWEGKYKNETGAHLRWGFSYNLDFPENGFDLYRRPTAGGAWELLNTQGRIHPVVTWEGVAPPSQWLPRGVDRLPPEIHARFSGANAANFETLKQTLDFTFNQDLYFAEGRDAPFFDAASADAFVNSQLDPVAQPDPIMVGADPAARHHLDDVIASRDRATCGALFHR